MKRMIIYFFSGTGNTWWIADRIHKQLQKSIHNVECFSIETLVKEDIETQVSMADHIILGFPVYGSTAPKLVREFIDRFPEAVRNQSISVFGTHAMASGDTAYYIGKLFVQKGYALRQARHFVMMNNFHVPRFRFYKPKNDHRVDRLLQKALPKVDRFVKEILENQNILTGKNILGSLLGGFQRKHVDTLIDLLSKEFEIDIHQCNKCGKCQRICPTHNIKKEGEAYQFGDRCIGCVRCYSQCPKSAILIGTDTKDKKKYPRYKGPGKDFDIHILLKK